MAASKTKLIQELKGIDKEVPADISKPIIIQLCNSNIYSNQKEESVIKNEEEVNLGIGIQQSPWAMPSHQHRTGAYFDK